jgi:hypothetical protein
MELPGWARLQEDRVIPGGTIFRADQIIKVGEEIVVLALRNHFSR